MSNHLGSQAGGFGRGNIAAGQQGSRGRVARNPGFSTDLGVSRISVPAEECTIPTAAGGGSVEKRRSGPVSWVSRLPRDLHPPHRRIPRPGPN